MNKPIIYTTISIIIIAVVYLSFNNEKPTTVNDIKNISSKQHKSSDVEIKYQSSKSSEPEQRTQTAKYSEIFKNDMKKEDRLKQLSESKRVSQIRSEADELIRKTQEYISKNNIQIPEKQIDQKEQEKLQLKKEKLKAELEKLSRP